MRIKVHSESGDTNGFTAKIQGSKDNSSWTNLYTTTTSQTSIKTVTLTNTDFYTYYKIVLTHTSSLYTMSVTVWEVAEYIEVEEKPEYINCLSLPLTSYEVGKIVNIEGYIQRARGSRINENKSGITDFIIPVQYQGSDVSGSQLNIGSMCIYI